MKKYILLSTLFCFCWINYATAQVNYNKLPVYIPAPPNAAELSKYGGLDVGLQTGSLNFKIPLLNIEGNQWNMPVDIQYSTSGIKVDQIASRVGLGWALNAGGVVTRNVNHKQDEISIRSVLPLNWNSYDQNFLSYLNMITNPSSAYDTEPDEFSFNFNGHSGKFILDDNGKVILMPYSNLNISFNSNGNESSSVVIKTPDGSTYYFEDRESTSVRILGASNPVNVANYVPTAWYLSRVILPNKEQVNFFYEGVRYSYYTGISQTISKSEDIRNQDPHLPTCGVCNVMDDVTTSFTDIAVTGKRLSRITFRSLVAEFDYVDRLDLDPPTGGQEPEKILSKIYIKNGTKILSTLKFTYIYGISSSYFGSDYSNYPSLSYRPYLSGFSKTGADEEHEDKYSFLYNDINGMPPRLSFSQDMNGFFNGKLNSVFIPKPILLSDQLFFSRATADRGADYESTLKGSLIQIIYPTGGTETIQYQMANHKRTENTPVIKSKLLSIQKTSTTSVSTVSDPFSPSTSENVSINGGAVVLISPSDPSPGPTVNLVRFQVIRQSDGIVVYEKTINSSNNPLSEAVLGLQPDISYVFKMTSLVKNIKCNASIEYQEGYITNTVIENVPGLRVNKIITTNDSLESPMIKKYYYSHLANLDSSSLFVSHQKPILFKETSYYDIRTCDENGGASSFRKCWNNNAYSSSQVNLYPYSQNHVYYSNVIEGFGDDFENGGISHSYIIQADRGSFPIHSEFSGMIGFKRSNSGFLNGLERERINFKLKNGKVYPIKRTVNKYDIDTRIAKDIDAYVITKYYNYPQHYNPPTFNEFEGFDIHRYTFYSAWVYNDSTTTYDYDEHGGVVKTQSATMFANPLHTQPTEINSLSSDNKLSKVTYKYPHEMVFEGRDPSGVYQAMINDHVIQPVVEERQSRDTVQTSYTRINYSQPNPHQYYPSYIQAQSRWNSLFDSRIRYGRYDDFGNALSVSQESGPKVCYIWGYGKSKLIAEIKNADYNTIEAVLGGSVAIHNFCSIYAASNSDVINFLAPLRTDVRLKDASVNTFTYDLAGGISTQIDPKGVATHYDYDGFQRLKYVKDQHGNIVKSYDYHYKP